MTVDRVSIYDHPSDSGILNRALILEFLHKQFKTARQTVPDNTLHEGTHSEVDSNHWFLNCLKGVFKCLPPAPAAWVVDFYPASRTSHIIQIAVLRGNYYLWPCPILRLGSDVQT